MGVRSAACPTQGGRLGLALAIVSLLVLTAACAPAAPSAPAQAPVSTAVAATPAPSPTVVPLTGKVTRAAIEVHPGWENLRAQDYTPDPAAVSRIRENAADFEALLFVGSWCPDTRRELPRFLKVMDQAGIPESKLTMIGLDRTKKDAGGLTEKWDLKYVPTFIVLRKGKELGRIVEKAQTTLEADLVQILGSPKPLTLSGSRPDLRTAAPAPTADAAAAKAVEPATITVQEAKTLLDGPNRPPIFDARPKASYDAGHVPGAISLPLDELEQRLAEVPRDRLSIFYCVGKT